MSSLIVGRLSTPSSPCKGNRFAEEKWPACLGVVACAYPGITYTTRQKAVILAPSGEDLEDRSIPVPPIAVAIALAGGVVLLVISGREA